MTSMVREVRGQLGLALDPGEVEVPLVDQLAHRVVGADLALEQLGRQLRAVVVDAGRVRSSHSRPAATRAGVDGLASAGRAPTGRSPRRRRRTAHPLVGVRDGGVHPHRPAADAAEGAARERRRPRRRRGSRRRRRAARPGRRCRPRPARSGGRSGRARPPAASIPTMPGYCGSMLREQQSAARASRARRAS